jgi:flavin reductase (DIM6/NTAB) family NADH-FMN oxidoreductase RutF
MTIDSEQLRRAMRTWTTGVAVITAIHDGQKYGMTVNSFTSVSLEPPLIGITLKQLTHTHELAVKSGEFSITILSADQKELADRFAGKIADIKDRFAGIPTETLVIDAPSAGVRHCLFQLPYREFDPNRGEYFFSGGGDCSKR